RVSFQEEHRQILKKIRVPADQQPLQGIPFKVPRARYNTQATRFDNQLLKIADGELMDMPGIIPIISKKHMLRHVSIQQELKPVAIKGEVGKGDDDLF